MHWRKWMVCGILPVVLLWTGCHGRSGVESYWLTRGDVEVTEGGEIHPALARELQRHSAVEMAQLATEIRQASGYNRDLYGLQRRRRGAAASNLPGPVRDVVISNAVFNREDAVTLRIFQPRHAGPGLPVIIYLHGGGWCMGSAAARDNIAVGLCRAVPAVVVAVNYRLAPEYPYPAALDDIAAVVGKIGALASKFRADAQCLYLAGDGAGGNLAVAFALRNSVVDRGPVVRGMMLFYPALNLWRMTTPSWTGYGSGYGMDLAYFQACIDCYVPQRGERNRHFVSPVFADMRGMPPALLVTGQFDPLRDDAAKFARRMWQEARPVRYLCLPGMTCGWMTNLQLEREFGRVMAEAAEFVRRTSAAR
ncbi:MAG: alpha/beta hydrolase [Victivallales bacterium]|nr:alpha/beta hydrolase [Victivallales bacterium]